MPKKRKRQDDERALIEEAHHPENLVPAAFCLLRQCDQPRTRVAQLRRAVDALRSDGARARSHHLTRRESKADLCSTLRKLQVARRFVRVARARLATKRLPVVNDTDPFTLEPHPPCSMSPSFTLMASPGLLYKYNADSLFEYLHRCKTLHEPIARYRLTQQDLRRLDRKVSATLRCKYGDSAQLDSDGARAQHRIQVQHDALADCLDNAVCEAVQHMASAMLRKEHASDVFQHFGMVASQFAMHDRAACVQCIQRMAKQLRSGTVASQSPTTLDPMLACIHHHLGVLMDHCARALRHDGTCVAVSAAEMGAIGAA